MFCPNAVVQCSVVSSSFNFIKSKQTWSVLSKISIVIVAMYLTFAASCNNVLATPYSSCVSTDFALSDSYLRANTVYGYLVGQIDMKHSADNCLINGTKISFCLYNPSAAPTVSCDQLSIGVNETKYLKELNNDPLLGQHPLLQNIQLTSDILGDNLLCLTMPTSRGPKPLVCRNIDKDTARAALAGNSNQAQCTLVGKSCDDTSYSQSIFSFSGIAASCLSETLNNVFFEEDPCVTDTPIKFSSLRSFSGFQAAVKSAVSAALILYVILYGFKVALNHEYVNLDKIALFVIKLIVVGYFAVGSSPTFVSGREYTRNGVVEWLLPFFSSALPDFTYMVLRAGGSAGLCQFDQSKYKNGHNYALWDAIDCRIGYYLGLQVLYNIGSVFYNVAEDVSSYINDDGNNDPIYTNPQDYPTDDSGNPVNPDTQSAKNNPDVLGNVLNFAIFTLLFGGLMGGQFLIWITGLVFVIIFVSIVLHFITTYLVCLVTMYVMAYISPIFVPFSLFERTKSYFDAWLKVIISCTLQPAVLAGFIALMLTMYDSAIYGNCEFKRHDYTIAGRNISTFELRLPRYDRATCENSAGYSLVKYYTGKGDWEKYLAILFPIVFIGADAFKLFVALLPVFIFTVIFYFFSTSLSQFAADITSGPMMNAVTADPQKLIKSAMNAASSLKAALSKPKDANSNSKKGRDGGPKGKDQGAKGDGAGSGAGGTKSMGQGSGNAIK